MVLVVQFRSDGFGVDIGLIFGGRKGITYSGSGGPDAVEHVGSQGDGDEEVFGVADAHYVAGFVLRQPVRAGVYTLIFFGSSALIL